MSSRKPERSPPSAANRIAALSAVGLNPPSMMLAMSLEPMAEAERKKLPETLANVLCWLRQPPSAIYCRHCGESLAVDLVEQNPS